mgnify:CR=1 FL=1
MEGLCSCRPHGFLSHADILKGFSSADPALAHTLQKDRGDQRRRDQFFMLAFASIQQRSPVLPRSRTMAGSAGSSCTPSRMPVRRTHGRRTDTVKSLVMP